MQQLLNHIKRLLPVGLFFIRATLWAQYPSESVSLSSWPYTIALRDSNDIVKALNTFNTRNKDSGIAFFQHVFRKSESIGYEWGAIRSLYGLAYTYRNMGQYTRTLQAAERAIKKGRPEIYTDKSRLPIKLALYQIMGTAYNFLGYYDKAMVYYNDVIKMAGHIPELNRFRLSVYNDIATILPDMDMALSYFDKCYALARELHDTHMMAMALQNKAIIYEDRKRRDTSGQLIQASLELARKHKDTVLQYSAYQLASQNAMNRNEKIRAKAYLLKADSLFHQLNLELYKKNTHYRVMGEIYFKLKDFKKGEYYLLRAADTARMFNITNASAEISRSLFMLYREWGKHEKAFDFYKDYVVYKDSIVNEKIAQNIHLLEIQYRTAEKDKEIAEKERLLEKKNYFIAGALLLLLSLACTLYFTRRHFRQKQKLLLKDKEIEKLKAALSGEEQERLRIARELHDGIMVQFSTVKMNLSSMAGRRPWDKSRQELREVINDLDDATRELRRSAHNLLPDMLLAEGLNGALLYFCNSLQKTASTIIEFQSYGVLPALNQEYELMLYRIVQELVQNALKHAQAMHVIVQLDCTDNLLCITVEDDGTGFDSTATSAEKGFGLAEIKKRISSIEGLTEISSESGKGTTVYIELEISKLQLQPPRR